MAEAEPPFMGMPGIGKVLLFLSLFLGLSVVNPWTQYPIGLQEPLSLACFFLTALYLLRLALRRKIAVLRFSDLLWCLPLIVSLAGVLCRSSGYPDWHSVRHTAAFTGALLVVTAWLRMAGPGSAITALKLFLAAGLPGALYAALQSLGMDFAPYELRTRELSGTFGNSALLASTLLGSLAACFALRKGAGSGLLLIVAALLLFTLMVSGCRAGQLAFAITLGAAFLRQGYLATLNPFRRFFLAVSGVFVLIPVLLILLAPDTLLDSIDKNRQMLWQGTLRIIKHNPLTGTGPGSFKEVFPFFMPDELKERLPLPFRFFRATGPSASVYEHADNEFLELLAENGILGTILVFIPFIFFFIKTFRKLSKTTECQLNHISVIAIFTVVALIIEAFFSVNFRYFNGLLVLAFWTAVGYNSLVHKADYKQVYPIIMIIVTIILVLTLYPSVKTTMADIYIKRAIENVESKAPQRALHELHQAEKWTPENPDIHYKRAYLYYNLGLYSLSIRDYIYTVKQFYAFANVHYNLGAAFFQAGLYRQALAEFALEANFSPANARIYYYMARIYAIQGQWALVIESVNKARHYGVENLMNQSRIDSREYLNDLRVLAEQALSEVK